MFRPYGSRLVVVLAALSLAACGPNIGKADAYEQTADGMMASGAFWPAISAMEKATKYDANEPRRWVKLGRAQRAADQPALAAMSYQHALDLDPANIEALENMSVLLVRAGRYDEARTYVDPLLALSPDDIAGLLSLGAIAMFQKRFGDAEKYADRLIQIAPSSIGGYSLKAHVLQAMGKPSNAAQLLAKQVALNPNDVDLAMQAMDLFRESGDVQGVRDMALILAKLRPDDPRYQLESARALQARGRGAEAARLLANLQQRYRGNPDAMRAIGQFWLGALPRPQAIAKLTVMAETLRGRAQAAVADMLIDQGEAPTVVRILAPIGAADVGAQDTDVHATYAKALLAAGNGKLAGAAAQKLLDYDGANTVALIVRARLELARRDYAHALADAQLAASGDRGNEDAQLLVPQVYAAMGNKVLAERAWGDAQNRLPDSYAIHRQRIAWLVAQGRADDATDIAGTFARGHMGNAEAWRIYRDACTAAEDRCAVQAAGQL